MKALSNGSKLVIIIILLAVFMAPASVVQIFEHHKSEDNMLKAVNIPNYSDQVLIDSSGTATYIGIAKEGLSKDKQAFKIIRIKPTSNGKSIKYAKGTKNRKTKWANRTKVTYK